MLQTHFPTVMYDMLEEADTNGHAHIVSWCDGGRAFKIHKPDHMILLLNTYFSQTKYKSFLRQLQTYGFTRYTQGDYKGIVSHPLLIQGKRFLCLRMRRKVKKNLRQSSSQSSKPSPTTLPPPPLPSRVSQEDLHPKTVVSSDTSRVISSTPMEPVERQQRQNFEWPLPGSGLNFGQDFSSSCVSPVKSNPLTIKNPQDFNVCRMPLPTTANSSIPQELASDSMISNILDGIDDDLCDFFTKITEDDMPDNDLLPSTLPIGVEDEGDEWLKGITYEGAEFNMEPEIFDITLPPVDSNSNADADTSVVSIEGIQI